MGKRLNISQPAVILTDLQPLSDIFDIIPSDSLEQWYYVNSGEYSPNRNNTPLILTPTIKAVDESSGSMYSPSFLNVAWYLLTPGNSTDYSGSDALWPGRGFVRITAVADGDNVDYYCPTSGTPGRLVVKKNVPPPAGSTGGVTLCCVANYIDPRDSGVTYMVHKVVSLATNQDASADILKVELQCPPSQKFNALKAESSVYEFQAKLLGANNQDVTASHYIEWYGIVGDSTTEVLLNTLPCYTNCTQPTGKGQGKDTVRIDAMYAENISIVCRARKTTSASSALMKEKAVASVVWDWPKTDAMTVCKNGGAVDDNNRDLTFETVVNIKGTTLTEEQKSANLLINYLRRVSTSSSYTNMGWGQTVTVKSSTVKQTTSYSTPVHSEVYMLGALEVVTDGGEPVTDNGETVFARF